MCYKDNERQRDTLLQQKSWQEWTMALDEPKQLCNDVITGLNKPTRLALDLVLVEFF